MVNFITKEMLAKRRKQRGYKKGVNLLDHIRESSEPGAIAEFIGSGDFNAAFGTRQQYEVEAGRDLEPILYESFYNIVQDSSLPKIVNVNKLGPGGFVLEEIKPGGEVKFGTVGESSYSVRQIGYAVGLEYTKELVMFNEVWNMSIAERAVGIAYNALLNHIHINPILTASYGSANQTAADATGSTAMEKIVLTLDNAVSAAMSDTSNPRRGPYDLLIAPADYIRIKNAMNLTIQDGNGERYAGASMIQNVIAYDGWSGTRGKKSTTYAGVTAGKAYLISKQYVDEDFQSWVKQGLEDQMGGPDVSRLIMEQTVWDTWLGTYANPIAAVEEITLP